MKITFKVIDDNVCEISYLDAIVENAALRLLTRKEDKLFHLVSGDAVRITFGASEPSERVETSVELAVALSWARAPGYGIHQAYDYLRCPSCRGTFKWDEFENPEFCPRCGVPVASVLPRKEKS